MERYSFLNLGFVVLFAFPSDSYLVPMLTIETPKACQREILVCNNSVIYSLYYEFMMIMTRMWLMKMRFFLFFYLNKKTGV